jgi:hypothetical protein
MKIFGIQLWNRDTKDNGAVPLIHNEIKSYCLDAIYKIPLFELCDYRLVNLIKDSVGAYLKYLQANKKIQSFKVLVDNVNETEKLIDNIDIDILVYYKLNNVWYKILMSPYIRPE